MDNLNDVDVQHADKLLALLAELRRDANSCDVLLQAGSTARPAAGKTAGEKIGEARGVWAHRVVLAAASSYFRGVFNSSFEQCAMQVLVIKDVELETLQALVHNIYSPASLPENIKKVKELVVAAILLDVGDVRDSACACLERALAADNVFSILTFAERHSCSKLVTIATQYLYDNFDHVLNTNEFLKISSDTFTALLVSNRITAAEELILDAVLRWTQHQPQERRRYLSSLLRYVRLHLVPREVLVERVGAEPLASEQTALLQVIEGLTGNTEWPELHAPTVEATQTTALDTQQSAALLVIGGDTSNGCEDSVLLCSLSDGHWQSVAKMWAPRATSGAAVLDGLVYLIGGRQGSTAVRTVFMYNVATDSWLSGPTLNVARRWLGVAALSGRLYAVGGWNDNYKSLSWILSNEASYSAETLDPREGTWRSIANMSKGRRGLGVAVLGGKLYAVGGHDSRQPLNSVERYDPAAGKWETVEPMENHRDAVRVGVVDDAIYAVGGWKESNLMASVERYRAGSGWESAPSMSTALSSAAVTAYGSRLYSVGGYNGGQHLDKVLIFDQTMNEWSEMPALPMARSRAAAVVVPWPP